LDTNLIPTQSLEEYYHINGVQLERHHKERLSNYTDWEQKPHADEWLLFPQNMGTHLSIDETSLSNGE
jgi:S-formylglutathione hydrolase FrmB